MVWTRWTLSSANGWDTASSTSQCSRLYCSPETSGWQVLVYIVYTANCLYTQFSDQTSTFCHVDTLKKSISWNSEISWNVDQDNSTL